MADHGNRQFRIRYGGAGKTLSLCRRTKPGGSAGKSSRQPPPRPCPGVPSQQLRR